MVIVIVENKFLKATLAGELPARLKPALLFTPSRLEIGFGY